MDYYTISRCFSSYIAEESYYLPDGRIILLARILCYPFDNICKSRPDTGFVAFTNIIMPDEFRIVT